MSNNDELDAQFQEFWRSLSSDEIEFTDKRTLAFKGFLTGMKAGVDKAQQITKDVLWAEVDHD